MEKWMDGWDRVGRKGGREEESWREEDGRTEMDGDK